MSPQFHLPLCSNIQDSPQATPRERSEKNLLWLMLLSPRDWRLDVQHFCGETKRQMQGVGFPLTANNSNMTNVLQKPIAVTAVFFGGRLGSQGNGVEDGDGEGDTAKPRHTTWIKHPKQASQQRSLSNLFIKEITVMSGTDRHAYIFQHTDQMLGLATVTCNKAMKSRLHYSTSKVYCPFWSLKRWHLHVHKETACKAELWFRGAPQLHWTHTGSGGETSVTSLL